MANFILQRKEDGDSLILMESLLYSQHGEALGRATDEHETHLQGF